MPQIDVSFLNTAIRGRGAADYGFLVDRLDILQSQLESDGKLSPGDYDLLKKEAQKIYSHPGLTPAQRSNVEVKIANYGKQKSVDMLSQASDIPQMNRQQEDDNSKATLLLANNPEAFLTARSASLVAKIDQLSQAIDAKSNSGADTTAYDNELTATLGQYHDVLNALGDIKTKNPKSSYAAYVTTNSAGEIIDMKIDRVGNQPKYLPTNGLYGGLPLYAKSNGLTDAGKNFFTIGGQNFSEGQDVSTADGTITKKLIADGDPNMKQGGYRINVGAPTNVDVDLTKVRSQSSIPDGGWIQGDKGFLYKKNPDGTYEKHLNADKTKLGITDNMVIQMPQSFVKGIQSNVTSTVDDSILAPTNGAALPTGGMTPFTPPPATSTLPQQAKDNLVGPGFARTPAPSYSAPQSGQSIAGKVMGAAKGFFANLFGQ